MKINDILNTIYDVQEEVLNECEDFLYKYDCDYHTFDMAILQFCKKLEEVLKDKNNESESD